MIINIHNIWANFNRTFFISCLRGGSTSRKVRISSLHSSTSIDDNLAIGFAIIVFRPTATPQNNGIWNVRDEPTWHDSNTILKLAQAYSFSNQNTIQNSFTYQFTAHRDLVIFRNYYAHKNKGTKQKCQNLAVQQSIAQDQSPSQILLSYPLNNPNTSLLDIWVSELEQTINLMCE